VTTAGVIPFLIPVLMLMASSLKNTNDELLKNRAAFCLMQEWSHCLSSVQCTGLKRKISWI